MYHHNKGLLFYSYNQSDILNFLFLFLFCLEEAYLGLSNILLDIFLLGLNA